MKSNNIRKLLIFTGLFFILLLFVILSPIMGQPFAGIPFLLIPVALALFITFIIFLIADLFMKTRNSWNLLFFSLIISGALYTGVKIINLQVVQSKDSAAPVINSLNKYFADYNRFPDNIEELKPKYISGIPKSNMGLIGTKFIYKSQENNKDFWLSFDEFNADKWIYINSRNIWVLDD